MPFIGCQFYFKKMKVLVKVKNIKDIMIYKNKIYKKIRNQPSTLK